MTAQLTTQLPRASFPACQRRDSGFGVSGRTPEIPVEGSVPPTPQKVVLRVPHKATSSAGLDIALGAWAPGQGPPSGVSSQRLFDAAARGWARATPRPRHRPLRAPRPSARPPARPRAGARSRLIGCALSPDALLFPVCWENGEKKPGAEPLSAPARRPRPQPGEPSLRRAGARSDRASARAGASL